MGDDSLAGVAGDLNLSDGLGLALLNASALATAAVNSTNSTGNATAWPLSAEDLEHFLGDPDVLHALGLVLGVAAICFSRRFPLVLAVSSSISLGLWIGLVVQDRQAYGQPLWGEVELPEGIWVPIVAGLLSAVAAGMLVKLAWKAALALLTAGLVMLLALAVCRLVNVSPEEFFEFGAWLLSTYRVVGAIVLVVAVILSAAAVQKFHKAVIIFASAHLGVLLLLSGASHFSQRAGASEAPFSLLDDLARIWSEARAGNCEIWEPEEGEDPSFAEGMDRCDCGDRCRTEILAWILGSLTAVLGHWYLHRREAGEKDGEDDEKLPLQRSNSGNPAPAVVGARH